MKKHAVLAIFIGLSFQGAFGNPLLTCQVIDKAGVQTTLTVEDNLQGTALIEVTGQDGLIVPFKSPVTATLAIDKLASGSETLGVVLSWANPLGLSTAFISSKDDAHGKVYEMIAVGLQGPESQYQGDLHCNTTGAKKLLFKRN